MPRWRSHIYDRLSKLERFEHRIIRMEFVLTSSHHHLKGNESCRITAKVPGKTIAIRKDAETMIEAIDSTMRVLEKKVSQLWKDVKERNRRSRIMRKVKRGEM